MALDLSSILLGLALAGIPAVAAGKQSLFATGEARDLHALLLALLHGGDDGRLRAALAADTRMRADAYAGGDAAELKSFAEQVVAGAQPGIVLLKTAIVSPDWTEESVVEWTDTTQTALRHRTTRSVTVQVAGRLHANTLLFTVDVSQDRLSSGGWGPTAGHVMFTDPMLAENVE